MCVCFSFWRGTRLQAIDLLWWVEIVRDHCMCVSMSLPPVNMPSGMASIVPIYLLQEAPCGVRVETFLPTWPTCPREEESATCGHQGCSNLEHTSTIIICGENMMTILWGAVCVYELVQVYRVDVLTEHDHWYICLNATVSSTHCTLRYVNTCECCWTSFNGHNFSTVDPMWKFLGFSDSLERYLSNDVFQSNISLGP